MISPFPVWVELRELRIVKKMLRSLLELRQTNGAPAHGHRRAASLP